MKIVYEVEVDETQLVPLCKPEDVPKLWEAINAIAGKVWIEAHYDPYNEQTEKMARELEPFVDAIKNIITPKRKKEQGT